VNELDTVTVEFSREALSALIAALNEWGRTHDEARVEEFTVNEYAPGKASIEGTVTIRA
jgi:hypothetical protein